MPLSEGEEEKGGEEMIEHSRTFERNEIKEILWDYLRIDENRCGGVRWLWGIGSVVVRWTEEPVARCDVCKGPLGAEDTVQLWNKWVVHKEICEAVVHERLSDLWDFIMSDEFYDDVEEGCE